MLDNMLLITLRLKLHFVFYIYIKLHVTKLKCEGYSSFSLHFGTQRIKIKLIDKDI